MTSTWPACISPGLQFTDVRKSFGAVKALRGVTFGVAEGEAHGAHGRERRRQVHAAEDPRRHPPAGRRRGALARRAAAPRQPARSARARHRHGLPGDAVLPEPHGRGQHLRRTRAHARRTAAPRSEMRERTRALLAELHLPISPDAPAASLSVAHRQLLQVARALAFECQILVLDEPTTSLTDAEADHLFAVLEKLKAARRRRCSTCRTGCLKSSACAIGSPVLRDGAYVETCDRRASRRDHIVRAMVGRELPPRAAVAEATRTQPRAASRRCRSTALARRPVLHATSRCRSDAGEIVGLFGLVGSGRSELLETIFGLYAPRGRDRPRRRPAGRRLVAARRGARPASRWSRRNASGRGCSST